jgi:hypothetical protein
VNCWVKPLPTVNELGDTAVVTLTTVIAWVPVTDVSPTKVAVMVTAEVGVEGAVYVSVREFAPAAIAPPPLRLQVTEVAVEFDMTAVSVTAWPG